MRGGLLGKYWLRESDESEETKDDIAESKLHLFLFPPRAEDPIGAKLFLERRCRREVWRSPLEAMDHVVSISSLGKMPAVLWLLPATSLGNRLFGYDNAKDHSLFAGGC